MRVTLAALALVLALVAWRYAPPAARGADTPATEFSAWRAKATLARVLGSDDRPHPTGSPANAAVRGRLVGELERLGLQATSEERFVCGGTRCATVVNVMARLAGTDPALPAVLLACHYDSVVAGPGAADDGAGIASTLEVARALRAGPPLLRDVVLLVDDGEEQALLGAEAFVGDAARVKGTAAVVNVEARGTTGPSLLFELSPGSARLVGAAAKALPRPVTNSIYYTLYQRLPNDTDLTVFKREGMAGVNFAFVGGPLRYHTPRDDLAHLDEGSLQHHGDHALAMVRALGDAGGSWHSPGDAVFFDLLALVVVRWPQPWTLPLAIAGALLVVAAVRLARRRPTAAAAAGGAAWGAAAALATLLLAAALGWGLLAILRAAGALPYQWVAHGWPLRLAFWSLPVAVAGVLSAWLGPRLRARGAWAATWIGWSLLAVAAAALAPGVSYPLLVPVLVAGVAGVAAAMGRSAGRWEALPPLVAAALLAYPMAWMLYDGMGAVALPGVSALGGLVLTGALPALATAERRGRLRLAALAGAAVVVGAVAAVALPPFTSDAPQPLSLVLHGNGAGATRWVAGSADLPLPPALAAATPFAVTDEVYPWASGFSAWVAPGPAVRLGVPELAVEAVSRDAEGWRVRAQLRSPRGAPIAGLYVPGARLSTARVGGELLALGPPEGRDTWMQLEDVTLPAEGVAVELTFHGDAAVDLHVYDVQPGLGETGAALLRARPEWAVPIGRGDRSMVSRPLRLAPTGAP